MRPVSIVLAPGWRRSSAPPEILGDVLQDALDDMRVVVNSERVRHREDLAAMVSAATNAKRSPEIGDLSLQVEMVAGARNRHYLEFYWTSLPSWLRSPRRR